MTGVDLLAWAKTNKPNIPFILMTGFSMLLETQSAYEMGADEFISKPFKNSELMALINKLISEKEAPVVPVVKMEDFCKVPIDEFVARPKVDFDVYVKLSSTKIIKIAFQGDDLNRTSLDHYKLKGVKYLYILNKDFRKVIELNLNIGRLIKDRSDIAIEKKIKFLKYSGEVILEKAFVDGVDQDMFS